MVRLPSPDDHSSRLDRTPRQPSNKLPADMVTFGDCFRGRTVWISGHTGFVGSWLAEWLLGLGATVHGYALPPPSAGSSLFDQIGLASRLQHTVGDVRDREGVAASLGAAQPDFVFHLAAQGLVGPARAEPVETYGTNVMGTVHVLEALRALEKPCAAVVVTGDRCYEDRGWVYGYREDDALGGGDPYGSSQGMAELAAGAYRRSYFTAGAVRVASARAGNVIGGGDWTPGRLVPDCVRALQYGEKIPLRQPEAVRPWQHVLDLLGGYLWLAACLAQENGPALAGAYNFGPPTSTHRPVAELVQELLRHWPGSWEERRDPDAEPAAGGTFQLATEKVQKALRWSPVWDFAASVRYTMAWYRDARMYKQSANFKRLTQDQIRQFSEAARSAGAVWTRG